LKHRITSQKSSILFSTILLTIILTLIDINIRELSFNSKYLVSIFFLFSLIYLLQCFLCLFHKSRFLIPILIFISLIYSSVLLFQYSNYNLYHSFATNEVYKTLILDYEYWFSNFTALLDIKLIGYFFLLSFLVFIGFLIAWKRIFHFNTHKLDKYKFLILLGSFLFITFTTPRVKFQTAEVSFLRTLSSFLKHYDFNPPKKLVRIFDKIKAKKVDFNILLLVNESLRSDHLNIYGYTRKTSPNISKYFKDALLYQKCFSSTAVTHFGMQSIFTGLYPNEKASFSPTLWQYASQLQLQTFYFGSQVLSWSGGLDSFFLEYDYIDKIFSPITSDNAVGHDDSLTIHAFEEYMSQESSKPFFGVIHFNATHFPYLEHKQSDRYFPTSHTTDTSKKQELINAYDNAILNLDDSIGKVMGILKSHNILENTIIILVSDHAEAFGEHKSFFHTTIMHNEAINVPLLVLIPEKIKEKITQTKLNTLKSYQNQYISNVDVMPSILDFYGLSPTQKIDGINLFTKSTRKFIFSTTDTHDITFTYINTVNKNKYLFDNRNYELYFTNLNADPSEKNFQTIPMGRLQNRKMGMRHIQKMELEDD